MKQGNRFWRLDAYPEGTKFDEALSLQDEPVPVPQPGQVVFRNIWFSLDAGTRMWMTPRTDSYQPPLPLGAKVSGLAIGRVVASAADGFEAGQLVRAFGQWADYSLVEPATSMLTVLDETVADPRQHLAILGMTGLTAYVGITEAGRTLPGETVLVSAAAGATGLAAAQVAKIMGCRVIGIAGGAQKCRFLLEEAGLDAAIDHRSPDVEGQLQAAAPGGINVYFDNVGGALLDKVLPNMALYGRIAVCGLVAGYAERQAGPARYDQVLARRLQITGFFSPDFVDRSAEVYGLLRPWLDQGRIFMRFDESEGLENMLGAYTRLFTGANIGKVLLKIADP